MDALRRRLQRRHSVRSRRLTRAGPSYSAQYPLCRRSTLPCRRSSDSIYGCVQFCGAQEVFLPVACMMRILITGGSGFIGRNLAEQFASMYEVSTPSSAELDLLKERDEIGRAGVG